MKIALTLVLLSSQIVLAQEAQYIWSEENPQSTQIKVSEYANQQWGAPQTITDDKLLNFLPTIAMDSNGGQLAVWTTAQDDGSTVLRFSEKSGSQPQWSAAQIISSEYKTNLAPSLVFDQNNVAWLAWSANNDDDDEIYAASYNDNSWTKATLVHTANDDADFLPEMSLSSSNEPQIKWQRLVGGEMKSFQASKTQNRWVSQALAPVSNLRLNSNLNQANQSQAIEPPEWAKSSSRSSMSVRSGNKQQLNVFTPDSQSQ